MKTAFVNHSLDYLIKNNACSEKQTKIFKYTLESIYSLVTKTSVVILLSLILKTFSITLGILLTYGLLRGVAFGIHAKKNIYCWIITLTVYSIIPLIIKYIDLPILFIYISYIISFIAILLWAPADTPARPLLNNKKRIVNKFFSIIISLVLISISFIINQTNFYEIVSLTLLIETICICPLTYYLFKVPYNNYKNYKKK